MVRIKNRWLLINVRFDSDGQTAQSSSSSSGSHGSPVQLQLLRAIRDSLQCSFGDVAAGALGGSLAVRYYSPTTHNAIVRCSRLGVQHVWAAVTLCDRLDGKQVRMIVSHCGGGSCLWCSVVVRRSSPDRHTNNYKRTGTIRKVQQAAIRADRRKIERLCIERKRIIRQAASRTILSRNGLETDLHLDASEAIVLDQEAKTALEESKREIDSIEQ